MLSNAYLNIEGVKGDALSEKHKDQIRVLDYEWSVSLPSTAPDSGGAIVGGRATFKAFTIVKEVDIASPNLAFFCAQGKHLPSVVLAICRVINEDEQAYMEYTLLDAIITSVQAYSSNEVGGQPVLPRERVTFSYSVIKWKYTPTGLKGDVGIPIEIGCDTATGKKA